MSGRDFATREVLQDAAEAVGNGAALNVAGLARLGVQAAGSGSWTINFEATIDGQQWFQLPCAPIAGGAAVTTATAAGLWLASVAGLAWVRARVSAWSSGDVTVVAVATATAA